jgi:creatinine amidohydrolase
MAGSVPTSTWPRCACAWPTACWSCARTASRSACRRDLFDADELAHGLHGGAVETSLLLHLRPDLVRREALADFPSLGAALAARGGLLGVEKPVGIGWMTQDLNAHGAVGNAAAASADKGRAVLDHIVARLLQLLAEVEAMPVPSS